jgi:hypothetical protein
MKLGSEVNISPPNEYKPKVNIRLRFIFTKYK